MIPIVIGALGTISKGYVKGLEDFEIRGQMETIQTTALLRSARILRWVLETCSHSDTSEKPLSNSGVKTSQKSKIKIFIVLSNFSYLSIIIICSHNYLVSIISIW